MKKTIALSATVLALLVPAAASAKPPWGMAPEQRVERMAEKLDLTTEQQAEIRAILEDQQTQRRAERLAVREQIDAVLTDEQRATREAEIERRIERRVARITDRLELSSQQESELRALMTEKRDDPEWTPGEMRERLSGLLTENQLAELERMRSRRGQHFRGGWM